MVDECLFPRRSGRASLYIAGSANPPQPLDGSSELVRVHARVALRRVEVLVAEQLLDLAQVRARAQELGGEDVPQCVRRDALALFTPAALT